MRKEREMRISMNTLKSEVDRAFRVLGADRGFQQNATDICSWLKDGYITETEYKELRHYNMVQYSQLPLDA